MMETDHDQGASFTTANPVEAPAPTDQASVADKPASSLDDLTSLLSEFEAATAKPEAKDALKDQSKPQEPVDPVAAAIREGLDYDTVRGTLRTQGDALNHLYQHALAQKAREDFAQVKSDAVQKLQAADIPVNDDLVERWFASEAIKDPRLRDAWDNRLRSEQHWRRADKLLENSTFKLMKFLRSQIDADVTTDKMTVAAALKGASGTPPPEGPVRYGDLTDREFAAEKKKLGL